MFARIVDLVSSRGKTRILNETIQNKVLHTQSGQHLILDSFVEYSCFAPATDQIDNSSKHGGILSGKGGDVSRLPFSRSHLALGGLAVSLGFESLLAANINLDLLRLGFGLFGQLDFQHAIVIVGAHF